MPEQQEGDDDVDVVLAIARIVDIAEAKGDVPDDGSGVDGVYEIEVPSPGNEKDWHVQVNAEGEELPASIGGHSHDIPPYHAAVWWGTDLATPAALFNPNGGTQLVGDADFEKDTVEDQFIADAERLLDELGADYEPSGVRE